MEDSGHRARRAVRPGRYAAIDIGTVTCRMLVADVVRGMDGAPRVEPVAKEYAVVNLGEGVDETGRLSAAALARTMEAIDRYLAILAECDTPESPVLATTVIATSASRDAENADEFAALLAERGLELEVIAGEVEAGLSFAGASAAYAGERVAVVDIGGGSTEVSVGIAGQAPEWSHSFNVGCRRATERFWDGYPPSAVALDAARLWMRKELKSISEHVDAAGQGGGCGAPGNGGPGDSGTPGNGREVPGADENATLSVSTPYKKLRLIAVAGTATSAVAMRDGVEPYDPDLINGMVMTGKELRELIGRLIGCTLSEVERTRGLDPARAPVIVAGLLILREVMFAAGVTTFTASENDILEGTILYIAESKTS